MRRRWKIISCPTRKRFSPPRRIWRGIEASKKQFDVIHRKIPCWIKDWNCGPGVSRRVQALLEISLPLRSAQLECAAQPPQSAEWVLITEAMCFILRAGETAKRNSSDSTRRWKMAVDIVMPQMGESIFEGTITKWLKKPGDKVERDEPLFEISTDKVDAEIPSPSAGVLKEIKFGEGQTVPIQTVVGVIDAAGSPAAAAASAPTATPAKT